MAPEEEVKKLITAVGAMAELGHAMCCAFENAGFSHEDALQLVSKILSETIKPR